MFRTVIYSLNEWCGFIREKEKEKVSRRGSDGEPKKVSKSEYSTRAAGEMPIQKSFCEESERSKRQH